MSYVPVNCCDCERTFLSASSLLQHFAEHVKIKLARDNYDKLKLISKRSHRKCPRNNNNNECGSFIGSLSVGDVSVSAERGKRILRSVSPIVANSSCDNSSQSLLSDKSEATSSTELSFSENKIDEDVSVQRSPVLEAQKKDIDSSLHLFNNNNNDDKNASKQFCIEFNSEKMLINIERLSPNVQNGESVLENGSNNESTEIYGTVNDELDKMDDRSLKRKLSNRKQLVPKKIERSSTGLIKIAPKTKDTPPVLYKSERKSKPKKKYNCHLCVKSFGWSTDLKRHILVHTGERPFKCNKCSACFTRNFLLQKHKSKIHPSSKDLLEKNKLLEEKVNENLKQLKSKMSEFTNLSSVVENYNSNSDRNDRDTDENLEHNEETEKEPDEEMVFTESKLEIKEEASDPLSFGNKLIQDSSQEERYVNGNWFLSHDGDMKMKLIKSEDTRSAVVIGDVGEI